MYNEYKEPNVVYMDLVKAATGATKPAVQADTIVLSMDDFTQLLAQVENMTREIQKLTKEFDAVTKVGKQMIEQQTLMQYPKLDAHQPQAVPGLQDCRQFGRFGQGIGPNTSNSYASMVPYQNQPNTIFGNQTTTSNMNAAQLPQYKG